MPFVQTREGRLAYAARGQGGTPLVLVHGAAGSHRHWGLVFGELPDGVARYAVDLPGHGRSPGPGPGSSDVMSSAVSPSARSGYRRVKVSIRARGPARCASRGGR